MFSFFKKKSPGKTQNEGLDAVFEKNFLLKPLFPPEFGLLNLDLLETIGTGTFGRVRLARSLDDKKYYAIKIMKKVRIVRLNQLQHIQNEVQILSRLRCRFVAELFAVFQDTNSLFMLQEYIPGGELFSHLRKQEFFDLILYKFYAVEIACALREIHEAKVIYRDIKPENILIHRSGHIRLCDFGFSKVLDKEDRTYTLCGTPEYIAPEIIQGVGHGFAVDWWGLGILLFEMVAGYPCFFAENPFNLYQKILAGKIVFPPGMSIPQPTQAVIKGFLEVNRAKRLGCGTGGFQQIKDHKFFLGIDWVSAANELVMPPIVPSVISGGDTSNYDYYPEEIAEEPNNLTREQREQFQEFDRILERPLSTV